MADYKWYREKKDSLVKLINESSQIINGLSLKKYAEGLHQLGKKADTDTFKIQIVGTFKNGKSLFINSLLGENILPSKALPCTAVINEIKYGEKKRAVLNFRNPLPETLLSDIPAATMAHMKAHGMKNIPPMEIEYDRIEDYVTIPVDGDPEEISLMSPYLSVELYYPSSLLKEGVEIIDSPGLNENDERTAVTLEYLDKADAIIFLLDATHACAKDEMTTLEEILLPKGFDDIFFVVNKFDLISQREQPGLKQYVENKVKDYTSNPVYCLSAMNALEGKLSHDRDKLDQSGLPVFEERLSEFLTKEKGRIKLAKPAKELKGILTREALFGAIPAQRLQLATGLDVLRRQYDAILPELKRFESQKENLSRELALKVEQKENKIAQALRTQFVDIARMIPDWVNDFTPKTDPGIFAKRSKVEKICEEITEHVTGKVKEVFKVWNQDVLSPLVEESAIEIFNSTDGTLRDILDGIDEVQSQLSGNTSVPDNSSGWTRALGVAGICCGFASGATLLTGQFDIAAVAKSLAVDLGIGTGIVLLSITNPILAIGGLIAVVWQSITGGRKVVMNNIKREIIPLIQDSIRQNTDEKSKEIVARVDVEFRKYTGAVIENVDAKINDIRSQISIVLADKEKGEKAAQQRGVLLDQSELSLQKICSELDAFVFSLVETV